MPESAKHPKSLLRNGDVGRGTNPNFVESLHVSDAAHAWNGGDFGTRLSLSASASVVENLNF